MSSTTSTSPESPHPDPTPLTFRLQPDGRQVLSRKRARELLAPLSTAPFTSISLGGCALGDAAAGVAGPALVALANKQCLRSVTLSDCIASLPQDEALRSLSALASSIGMWKGLHSVDLSYNALGSRGVAACAALLQGQRYLRDLHLIEAGLAAESARLLQRYLCPAPTTQLRVLQVHANRLESQGVAYLAVVVEKSPHLERLRMSSLGASSSGLATLVKALQGKVGLRDLDLSDNFLDAPVAAALAGVLITLTSLERLLVRDLAMGDDAVKSLLGPLVAADPVPPIAELALAGNELTSEAAGVIGDTFLAFQKTLQVLELSRNELGGVGAEKLTNALATGKGADEPAVLTHLLLAENGITALAAVHLSLQLLSFPTLECLDFSGNFLFADVTDRLGTALGSSVVLYDGTGPEAEDGDMDDVKMVEPANGGTGSELQAALQELANAPSVVKRPESPPAPEVVMPTASSSQSTVSMLRSFFSRGSEETKRDTTTEEPAEKVQGAIEAAPIGGGRGFVEDDSGIIASSPEVSRPEVADRVREGGPLRAMSISTTESRDAAQASPFTPRSTSNTSRSEVIQSAKKLKESIASLNKEIADVAGELQIPMSSPSVARSAVMMNRSVSEATVDENIGEYLLVDGTGGRRKQSRAGMIFEAFGGLLSAAFLVVLILALVDSLEESKFSYQLV
eukprot:GFKZ01013658.1.p1 GENE.GFKZ01013658.1~~GFKZ01013658.1.p1  ORF type:complete len:685 (+),score=94.72 GFKZ01013658.1:211-2265(+)